MVSSYGNLLSGSTYKVDRKEMEEIDGLDDFSEYYPSDGRGGDSTDREVVVSPFRTMTPSRRRRKFNCPKLLQPSVLIILGILMVMLETRCVYVRGFIPNARISEAAIYCSSEFSMFPTAGSATAQNLNHGQSKSVIGSKHNVHFTSSSSIEHEKETINLSLEWVEFYAPSTKDTDSSEEEEPVLFLHGLLGSKRNFATCANMLSRRIEKKRRIIGVDLRNHGDTQPWSDNMSYPIMAQDVVHFLKSQNMEKVILVGHSMGGKVAQALALLHPEYVSGLVVLDIAPVTYTREADPHWRAVEDILRAVHKVIEDAAATGEETNKREIDLSLRKAIPDPALRAFVLTNYDSRNNKWKVPIGTMVQELEQIAGFDLTASSLTASKSSSRSIYEGDVFIINGGQSRFVRHAYMDQIASFFPNHMLTTIRGSGHWVHAEAPDDLVALLKRYLDR